MDGKPLPPALKQRIIERGCSYLLAVGRALDPPETVGASTRQRPADSQRKDDRALGRSLRLWARFRRAAWQLLGL